jgi:DNA-binding response OmpR family regulator
MALHALLLCRDASLVEALCPVMHELQIDLDVCASQSSALAQFARRRFDAIIVDCEAVENAGELMGVFRADPENRHAIALGIVAAADGMHAAFDMGANLILSKPLTEQSARRSLLAAKGLMTRRRYSRFAIQSLAYVDLRGQKDRAILLDLSEAGLSLQALEPLRSGDELTLSFELPGTGETCQASAQVMWSDSSGRSGVRFSQLNEVSGERLRAWIAARTVDGTPVTPPAPPLTAPPPTAVIEPLRSHQWQRATAWAIDFLVVLGATAILGLVLARMTPELPSWQSMTAAGLLIVGFFYLAYRYIFQLHRAATAGDHVAEMLWTPRPPDAEPERSYELS